MFFLTEIPEVLCQYQETVSGDTRAQDGPREQRCKSIHCNEEIFAACHRCRALLCFQHSDSSEECIHHTVHNFVPAKNGINHTPESYQLDEPISNDLDSSSDLSKTSESSPKEFKSKNKLVKENRNKGQSYFSEKSGKFVLGRKYLNKPRCNSSKCKTHLGCDTVRDNDMKNLNCAYYESGSLALQREWLARHVSCVHVYNAKNKKHRAIVYSLPNPSSGETVQVCRKMFLNTLGISDRQIRTVLERKKHSKTGVLGKDRRGGTQNPQPHKRQQIVEHLQRFPRVESHYCRSSTKATYVSGDLTKRKMYRMFKQANPNCASYSLYKTVMREQNIKIHRPKKDKCGICESFRKASDDEKKKTRSCLKHIERKSAKLEG